MEIRQAKVKQSRHDQRSKDKGKQKYFTRTLHMAVHTKHTCICRGNSSIELTPLIKTKRLMH